MINGVCFSKKLLHYVMQQPLYLANDF
uniref:Uncharacterized protein n=1 Tax=Anguilla anguilla TaxID=7936 RepID=A0A0E9W1H1_ANGAN